MIIESKVLGSRKRPFEPWETDFLAAPEALSLRAFLQRVVQMEVEAFKLRQEERKLIRVLSKSEIAEGVDKGKVDMGGRDLEQEVDVNEAIENALLAFEDGFYYVFVDDLQIQTLDTQIDVFPHSKVLFLRLVPLVGGLSHDYKRRSV